MFILLSILHFQVKLVPSHEGATDLVYALYCSYQMKIHNDPASKLKMDRYKRFLVKSPLKVISCQLAFKMILLCFSFFLPHYYSL